MGAKTKMAVVIALFACIINTSPIFAIAVNTSPAGAQVAATPSSATPLTTSPFTTSLAGTPATATPSSATSLTTTTFNSSLAGAPAAVTPSSATPFTTTTLISSLAGAPAAATPSFSDVGVGDWYYPYIMELAARGLTKGYEDGSYGPDRLLQVDEFLAFALRTDGQELPNAKPYWAQNYIDRALEMRLIRSRDYDDYEAPITREKIAEIVVRLSNEQLPKPKDASLFTDIDDSERKIFILQAFEMGVLAGYEDKTFRPGNSATRAEAATIVLRMIDKNYRVEKFGDIIFSASVDLNKDGVMKSDKAQEFMMQALNSLHIEKSNNGRAVISGYVPVLPEGQRYVYHIAFHDISGSYLSFHSTVSVAVEQQLPNNGSFNIETNAFVNDIAYITIDICVEKNTPEMFSLIKPTVVYSIQKTYFSDDYKEFIGELIATDNFYIETENINGAKKIDFELINNIWGW